MCGGHMDREITALVYSEHLSLLASGSQNGSSAIWDFDAGKLETTLFGHEGEVTHLEFIEGYPLLMSSSADGTICLWGTKPIVNKWRYKCILRLYHTKLTTINEQTQR